MEKTFITSRQNLFVLDFLLTHRSVDSIFLAIFSFVSWVGGFTLLHKVHMHKQRTIVLKSLQSNQYCMNNKHILKETENGLLFRKH